MQVPERHDGTRFVGVAGQQAAYVNAFGPQGSATSSGDANHGSTLASRSMGHNSDARDRSAFRKASGGRLGGERGDGVEEEDMGQPTWTGAAEECRKKGAVFSDARDACGTRRQDTVSETPGSCCTGWKALGHGDEVQVSGVASFYLART
jgi:hypothetical protein